MKTKQLMYRIYWGKEMKPIDKYFASRGSAEDYVESVLVPQDKQQGRYTNYLIKAKVITFKSKYNDKYQNETCKD